MYKSSVAMYKCGFCAVNWFVRKRAPKKAGQVQSGRCSLAKHGDAYFSAICGSIQDPIAAPGLYENQEC